MTSTSEISQEIISTIKSTSNLEQMTVAEATQEQFRLVDSISRVLGSDQIFFEDYGQERSLGVGAFGSGGRPIATAKVEEVLSHFLGTEDTVLVHGAGTGSIRAMLSFLEPGSNIILHSGLPYKTTVATLHRMAIKSNPVDFNHESELRNILENDQMNGILIQHVPHQFGDNYNIQQIIGLARTVRGGAFPIFVDDNYAAMRSKKIGVQMGASASALSLFKLLARANIGCVSGKQEIVTRIRQDSASAGSQVQGPDAMDALRSIVYAPVALAIHNLVVIDACIEINRLISVGEVDLLAEAIPGPAAARSIVLVFKNPIAENFLQSVWRNGSPSRSVGEEARYDLLPLFTYIAGTYLKSNPLLKDYVIRVNPLRGGTATITRILKSAVEDSRFQSEIKALVSA